MFDFKQEIQSKYAGHEYIYSEKTPKTIKKVFTSPNNNVWVISVESDHRAKPKKIYVIHT